MKSYKDPYGQQFNYSHDKTGRLLSLNGATAFAGITNYANNAEYRAWGDLKKLGYGNGTNSETTYNNQLRPANFKLRKSDSTLKMDKIYNYYADGSLKTLEDKISPAFDRINKYDHLGRIKESKAGVDARGEPHVSNENDNPYTQNYNYDAFGQLKGRNGTFWGNSYTYQNTYQNGRVTAQMTNGSTPNANQTWQYDADGRAVRSYDEFFNRGEQQYDAAGGLKKMFDYGYSATAQSELTMQTDGDGRGGRKNRRVFNAQTGTWTDQPARYYITSSVFGGEIITEVNETGRKLETRIIAAGRDIAEQKIIYDASGNLVDEEVEWQNLDSFGLSDLRTRKKGQSAQTTGTDYEPLELDLIGTELQSRLTTGGGGGGLIDPEIPMLDPSTGEIGSLANSNPGSYGAGGGAIGQLCVIYGSIVVEWGRVQLVDGYGRSGSFAMLERMATYSSQVTVRTATGRAVGTYGDWRSVPENAKYHIRHGNLTANYSGNWSVNAFAIDASVPSFISNQAAIISEQLTNMADENCANAFKAAGLKTPAEVVKSGITIFPAYLLGSPNDMSKFGLNRNSTEDLNFRDGMLRAAKQSLTQNDITTPPQLAHKGRLYMALPQRAFDETDGPFSVSFVHAMMHAAGAVGRLTHPEIRIKSYRISITPEDIILTTTTEEVPNRSSQHDLTWMDKKLYDAIIENCAKK